jgi:hypothetical protein
MTIHVLLLIMIIYIWKNLQVNQQKFIIGTNLWIPIGVVWHTYRRRGFFVDRSEEQSSNMERFIQWKSSISNGTSSLVQQVWWRQRRGFCNSNLNH